MKTIKKDNEIIRVDDNTAEFRVKNSGYSYASKSEWKEKVRDVVKEKKESKKDKKKQK